MKKSFLNAAAVMAVSALVVLGSFPCLAEEAAGEAVTEEAVSEETTAEATTEEAASEEAAPAEYVYEDETMKIAPYSGLTYWAVLEEVTDEDVEVAVEDELSYYSDQEHVMEGAAADGDEVNIDYVGTVDGEEFEGSSGTDEPIYIGEEYFLPEVEQGIIGMTPGETKEIEAVLPDYYPEEVVGKTALFTVTLNYIYGGEVLPELNDEFVAEYTEYSTVEEFKEGLRVQLEDEAQMVFEAEREDQIIGQIMAKSIVVEVPQELIDRDVTETLDMYHSYAEMFGMEYEEFLTEYVGAEEETLKEELALEAEDYEKERMVLAKIAELEGIVLSDEGYEEYLLEMVDEYGYDSVEDLKSDIDSSIGLEDSLRAQREEEMVRAFLVENARYEALSEDEELIPLDDEELTEEDFDTEEILVEDEEPAEEDGEAVLEDMEEDEELPEDLEPAEEPETEAE